MYGNVLITTFRSVLFHFKLQNDIKSVSVLFSYTIDLYAIALKFVFCGGISTWS